MVNPFAVGAYGLIAWGAYKLFKRSPVSTQATPVIPSIIKPAPVAQPAVSSGTANIAAIQSRLNALGANPPLVVDGISGPKTLAAIQAFQSANGITPDGIVGPITQAALAAGGPVGTPIVQPTVSYTPPVSTFTPVDTSVSTNIHDVHQWADEPEQSLVFRNR